MHVDSASLAELRLTSIKRALPHRKCRVRRAPGWALGRAPAVSTMAAAAGLVLCRRRLPLPWWPLRPRAPAGGRRRGDAAASRLCELGLQLRLDKFGGLSLHLAQLRSPEKLDQAAFQGWLRGKCVLQEASGDTNMSVHVAGRGQNASVWCWGRENARTKQRYGRMK